MAKKRRLIQTTREEWTARRNQIGTGVFGINRTYQEVTLDGVSAARCNGLEDYLIYLDRKMPALLQCVDALAMMELILNQLVSNGTPVNMSEWKRLICDAQSALLSVGVNECLTESHMQARSKELLAAFRERAYPASVSERV